MKVLISSFSCRPGVGSEFDVGWHWPVQAAREHEVWVLTPKRNEPSITEELARHPIPNLHFCFHPMPAETALYAAASKLQPFLYATYLGWQASAVQAARRLHAEIGFDLAHHVTWVSHRFPSLLAWSGVPFIWGPVGGGEGAPPRLYPGLGARGALGELSRDASNLLATIDPLVRKTVNAASTILTTSEETRRLLRNGASGKSMVYPAIGVDVSELEMIADPDARSPGREPRLLFVGRLANWKGCGLALRALARLEKSGLRASLTVVGEGPEHRNLQLLASRLGIADRVAFRGSMHRREVLALYREHDAFVFPSLHDSGGIAVLEAMYMELPVVCLDLGGPALSVGEAGIRVPVRDTEQVVRDLAAGLQTVLSDSALRQRLTAVAKQRVIDVYDWQQKAPFIRELYCAVRRGAAGEERASRAPVS